jgi:hypothetical protein
MATFKIKHGSALGEGDKARTLHEQGEIIESARDLAAEFPEKFEAYTEPVEPPVEPPPEGGAAAAKAPEPKGKHGKGW